MTAVSNGQFWIYTIALLIFWIIVLTTALNNESKINNQLSFSQTNAEDELKNKQICNNLCQQCGCLAFYCGEECICECNDDHADTDCIKKIQINAQDLNIPFEVLIQGPTVNNFVRKAFQYEQNRERQLYGYRNKRSTVTIYKPIKRNQDVKIKSSGERETLVKDILNITNKQKTRRKRSKNNQFDWLGDIRNNLLRPAPLGGNKRRPEEPKHQTAAPTGTTMSTIFDKSWIFDNTHNILTPRPLNKCKSPKILNNVNHGNDADASVETTNKQFKDQFDKAFKDDGKTLTNYSNARVNDKISLPTKQSQIEESKEYPIASLPSPLFGNYFNRFDDKSSLLSQEDSQDYLTGDRHSPLLQDDLNKLDSDKSLFSEELEEQKNSPEMQAGVLNSSPDDIRSGLQIPWLEPAKLLQKFKRVINS